MVTLNNVLAQSNTVFAPVGAYWYYTNIPSFFSLYQNYVKVESIGDTIIQRKNCRRLTKKRVNAAEKEEFLYISGDTVYRLSDNNKFYVLYNFGAQPGDTWLSRSYTMDDGTEEDSLYIKVDSISSIQINGYQLRVLYVSSTHPYLGFGGYWQPIGKAKIIERLGGTWYMLPHNYAFLDNEIRIGLRCYFDDSFGLYNSGIVENCDDIILEIDEPNYESPTTCYPNPFIDKLNFDSPKNILMHLTIFNTLEQPVYQQYFTNQITVSTQTYPQGVYYFILRDSYGHTKSGKLIKL